MMFQVSSRVLGIKFQVEFSIIIFILGLLFSCKTDMEKIKKIAAQKDAAIQRGKGVEIFYTDSANVKVKVIAATMLRVQKKEPYLEMPNGVKVYFYDEDLTIQSTLTANYGISYESKGEMIARNNVVIINIKGEKLTTEELIWNEKQEKIYSNKFVTITTADEIIYGDGFESNQDFTNYTITHIKGTINIEH